MATNWTDATLFVSGDVVLPKVFSGLSADADINFQADVKVEIGKEIKYRYHDVEDFDIQEITTASITSLKDTALILNLYYICRDEVVKATDGDTFVELGNHYWDRYRFFIKRDIELMEFDEPDGINDLKAFSIAVKR